MAGKYGQEVFNEIKARGEWGSFFSYSQYQRLKHTDNPAAVIQMAEKNGYKELDDSMSPSELVECLWLQGSGIAEREDIWTQAMVLSWFDPVMTVIWVLFDKLDRRRNQRKRRRETKQSP